LVFVVLLVSVRERRSAPHDLFLTPGFIACLVASVALIVPIGYFIIRVGMADSLNRRSEMTVNFHNSFGRFTHQAGPMLIGAWIVLALMGRWKPGPSWPDRLGCFIGVCIALIYAVTEIYYMLWPLWQ
jgi:hypothetical protein